MKTHWLILAVLASITLISFQFVQGSNGKDLFLKAYFLDVGQGDSILLQAVNGNQMLIDGGPDSKVLQSLGEVMPYNDKTIDIVLVTHYDADHLNGLIDVLREYDVAHVIETGMQCAKAQCAVWNQVVEDEGAERTFVAAGDLIHLAPDVHLKVVYPLSSIHGKFFSKTNNQSIVLRLEYGENSMLLTGDIEKETEYILSRMPEVASRILKVAHHGSKTSSTDAFLNTVKPETAFMQLSVKNTYGHPHPSVIQRLDSRGIKYYRTDIDGTIEVLFDTKNYFVNN